MATAEAPALLRVEVAFSPRAGVVEIVELGLPAGSTLRDAVERSGLAAREAPAEPFAIGVWGRRCAPGDAVHDGDRVEIYRPLQVDPKEARRLRQRRQREASAAATCSPKR
jgi:putative ubiquitin-RnfH superfamily antitoxin RatB of RatAB toxin-antitoxin module